MDAAEWDARYREQDLVWSAEPNATVAAEVAGLPPGRALDLACGEGRNAIWLAERGWRVEALDFSAVALDKARAMATLRDAEVVWRHVDLTTAPRLARADLVLVGFLHLPRAQLRDVHRRAARAVAPGGTLLVVGHARSNLERGVGGPSDPDVLLQPDEVRDDLADTDLVIEKVEEVERPVDTDEGPRTAIDLLLRASRPPTGV